MREQRRACAVLGLGPFAHSVIERLPAGVPAGPCFSLRLGRAPSRAGHDWLPPALRGPGAPSLVGTRAGGRLDVLAAGRATLRAHEPALATFRARCRDAGVPATLIVLAGLFDAEAAGVLDLAAMLQASESLEGVSLVLLAALSPPSNQEEPRSSARAALALEELDAATQGGPWELPQPGGVLSSPQTGSPLDAALLVWPSGPRWGADEARTATADAIQALPWLPELPAGGLAGMRSLPVLAPAAELRDRLAERYTAVAVEHWLAPGGATADLADVERRALAGGPREADDWLGGVQRRVDALVQSAEELAAQAPDAAADRVRGEVPALDRELVAEIGAEGPMRRAADDAARRWTAAARAQGRAIADELAADPDGGGFALIELAQLVPERLAELREAAERGVAGVNPGTAREQLDAAAEALREAIDKPAGLSVRLLGRGGPRLMQPLTAWADACIAWAESHWAQAAARVEAGALRMLGSEVLPAANQIQAYEVHLREAVDALRRAGRGANERPTRGVLVLPTGAAGLDEAAERLEGLGGPARRGWMTLEGLGSDPSPILVALRDQLRARLGPAEARLTLAGALASLPDEGAARAALDLAVRQAAAPLLGGSGHEDFVAVLPTDVEPAHLGLPEGTRIVLAPRREDGLLVRVAGGFDASALGLRKAALDEGLSRLTTKDPSDPDLLWRRFPAG
ncbi:MAG: hypothetical protein KDA24_28255 [Deltaproteobacteria bacterium]|nr:hypothetical protein [Deltaproteobacteria bacterium]